MNIIDHGKWQQYEPTDPPELWPKNVLFVQRETDNKDWYQYIKDGNFSQYNVKFQAIFQQIYNGYIIGPAVYDATMLFPRNQVVGEITDYTGSNPQTDFGGKLYDPVAGTITDRPPQIVPPPPEDSVVAILGRIEKRLTALEGK